MLNGMAAFWRSAIGPSGCPAAVGDQLQQRATQSWYIQQLRMVEHLGQQAYYGAMHLPEGLYQYPEIFRQIQPTQEAEGMHKHHGRKSAVRS